MGPAMHAVCGGKGGLILHSALGNFHLKIYFNSHFSKPPELFGEVSVLFEFVCLFLLFCR